MRYILVLQASVFALYATVSSWAFSYCLWVLFGKDAPWFADLICGIITGSLVVPGALVMWALRLAGVIAHPIFG